MFLEEARKIRDLINDVEQADNWIQAVGKKEFTALAYNKGKGIDYFYLVDTELRKKIKQTVVDHYSEKRSKAVDELDRIGKDCSATRIQRYTTYSHEYTRYTDRWRYTWHISYKF